MVHWEFLLRTSGSRLVVSIEEFPFFIFRFYGPIPILSPNRTRSFSSAEPGCNWVDTGRDRIAGIKSATTAICPNCSGDRDRCEFRSLLRDSGCIDFGVEAVWPTRLGESHLRSFSAIKNFLGHIDYAKQSLGKGDEM